MLPVSHMHNFIFRFCGNAKLQLLETIKRLSIVPEEYLETVLRVYMDYCTPKGNS